jgi:hypothetical protein
MANRDSILAKVTDDASLDYGVLDPYIEGEKWYLPAKDELQIVYANKAVINEGLNQAKTIINEKYPTLKIPGLLMEGDYWTSTEINDSQAYGISFTDGSLLELNKKTNGYLLGMRNF